MERDILVEVNHPFIVKLHYGKQTPHVCTVANWENTTLLVELRILFSASEEGSASIPVNRHTFLQVPINSPLVEQFVLYKSGKPDHSAAAVWFISCCRPVLIWLAQCFFWKALSVLGVFQTNLQMNAVAALQYCDQNIHFFYPPLWLPVSLVVIEHIRVVSCIRYSSGDGSCLQFSLLKPVNVYFCWFSESLNITFAPSFTQNMQICQELRTGCYVSTININKLWPVLYLTHLLSETLISVLIP